MSGGGGEETSTTDSPTYIYRLLVGADAVQLHQFVMSCLRHNLGLLEKRHG